MSENAIATDIEPGERCGDRSARVTLSRRDWLSIESRANHGRIDQSIAILRGRLNEICRDEFTKLTGVDIEVVEGPRSVSRKDRAKNGPEGRMFPENVLNVISGYHSCSGLSMSDNEAVVYAERRHPRHSSRHADVRMVAELESRRERTGEW
jgi:hypothetical protein